MRSNSAGSYRSRARLVAISMLLQFKGHYQHFLKNVNTIATRAYRIGLSAVANGCDTAQRRTTIGASRMAQPQNQRGYQSGFGNEFATEAHPGALPQGQNAPQHAPLGLYTEQISGTAFTAPRSLNRRTWSYRIRPSVMHEPYREFAPSTLMRSGPFTEVPTPPNQMRWNPLPMPTEPTDFVDGIVTLG